MSKYTLSLAIGLIISSSSIAEISTNNNKHVFFTSQKNVSQQKTVKRKALKNLVKIKKQKLLRKLRSRPAGAIYALTNGHNPINQISASDDAVNEPSFTNEIVAYSRLRNGELREIGVYETGGLGENIRNSGANPLASQDPLIVSNDKRFVFAVNAGSESISSFVIQKDMTLEPASLDVSTAGATNGQNPISLTQSKQFLYVANTGAYFDEFGNELTRLPADRNRDNSSIIGFVIGKDGTLSELDGSEIPDIAANAGSIEFSSDGSAIYITERRTNRILTVAMTSEGLPARDDNGEPIISEFVSQTDQPFGTDLFVNNRGVEVFVVSEGNNGAPGLSALSSYTVSEDSSLAPGSLSTGVEGDPLTTGFTFGCWVEIADGPFGDFAFVSNTPDGTITSYRINNDGTLNRLESEAGNAGIEGDDTQNGGGVLDAEVAYPFLYQVVNNDSRIAQWRIDRDGSLERMLDVEIVNEALFRPRMFVGIAGF